MKLLKLAIISLMVLGLVSPCFAEDTVNPITQFIKDRVVKTGITYDVFAKETKTVVGMILVEDFYLENLDLDLFIDGDKSVIAGLDYMFRKGNDIQPYIGVGVGLDRIEQVDTFDEWGEYFATLNAGVRFKF